MGKGRRKKEGTEEKDKGENEGLRKRRNRGNEVKREKEMEEET